MRPFDAAEMASRGVSHDEMWSSYYVISSTRNTWARAASGYDYTQDRWVQLCERMCMGLNPRELLRRPRPAGDGAVGVLY